MIRVIQWLRGLVRRAAITFHRSPKTYAAIGVLALATGGIGGMCVQTYGHVGLPGPPGAKENSVVTDVASQCIPERAEASGTVFIHSPNEPYARVGLSGGDSRNVLLETCMNARLADYPIPDGIYSFHVEPRPDSTMASLPYPIPHSSSHANLRNFTVNKGQVLQEPASSLASSLTGAGFKGHYYWFRFLDGFAVLTTPEKIAPSGMPISHNELERFDPAFDTKHIDDWLPLVWQTARHIIFTDAVDRRVFLFTCASASIQDTVSVNELAAMPSASAGDAVSMPVTLPSARSERTYYLRSFVYVFKQADDKDEPKLVDNGIQAEAALIAAGILK